MRYVSSRNMNIDNLYCLHIRMISIDMHSNMYLM